MELFFIFLNIYLYSLDDKAKIPTNSLIVWYSDLNGVSSAGEQINTANPFSEHIGLCSWSKMVLF